MTQAGTIHVTDKRIPVIATDVSHQNLGEEDYRPEPLPIPKWFTQSIVRVR